MKRVAPLFALLLLVTGCSSKYADINVESEVDEKTDLVGFGTYAWRMEAAVIRDPAGEWAPPDVNLAAEVRYLVNRELRDKGLYEAADSPDLLAVFGIGVDMKALGVVDDADEAVSVETPKGGLLVVLLDADTGKPVWAAAATGEVQDSPGAELVRSRLDYAITKMFKGYKP